MSGEQEFLLYEFDWSHYCNKVSMALDFKGIKYRPVAVDVFGGPIKELRGKGLKFLYPILYDPKADVYVEESTFILRYLDQIKPEPKLFIGDDKEVEKLCVEIDETVGLFARRLGYGRLIAECPWVVGELFVRPQHPLLYAVLGPVIYRFMSLILIQRFDMHRSIEAGIFEWADEVMTRMDTLVSARKGEYLFGNQLSAADISLATLGRPLALIPQIADAHPVTIGYIKDILERHGGSQRAPKRYETAVIAHRTRSAASQAVEWIQYFLLFPLTFPVSVLFHTRRILFPAKALARKTVDEDPSTKQFPTNTDGGARVDKSGKRVAISLAKLPNLDQRKVSRAPAALLATLWNFWTLLPQQIYYVIDRTRQKSD